MYLLRFRAIFAENQNQINMEKTELQEYAALIDEAGGLIVKLAGNLQRAERAIQGTDLERVYNSGAGYWTAEDAVAILHRLQVMRAGVQNELERLDYLEKKSC